MPQLKLPRSAYNPLTIAGGALAAITAVALLTILVATFLFEQEHNPYFGIFLYMVLPAVLLFGLGLIPIGMIRERRRLGRLGEEAGRQWPVIDFSRREHRNGAIVFAVGSTIVILVTAVGSFEAYHYSESVEFCGLTCHSVMEPEYTTYQSSPHARIACAECHIGSGADWFVKSKLSGVYQIWATLRNIYPRPIPTPISNLRPAEDTCEQCHWPGKSFGAQQRRFTHFLYDEENTAWPVNLLIKTGGGDRLTGQTAGIHWHVNPEVRVEYIARDDRRQEIPWVRVTRLATGEQRVYQNLDEPLSDEELAAAAPRVMDCLDCHNRPSHIYRSPDEAVDTALALGELDASLPYIKRVAVEAIGTEYATREEASAGILETIESFYRDEWPEVWEARREAVTMAVTKVDEIYRRNVFPEMGVNAAAYPSNAGHFDSVGCMRCHDETHVADSGEVIGRDCTLCHAILSQGSGERREIASSEEGLDFQHPEDIDELWRDTGCWECHEGGQP